MPFKSEAQRRKLWATNPEVAREFAAATPKGTKLPERAKSAYLKGCAAALDAFGLRTASEELRLKIPERTFHGHRAALKAESDKSRTAAEAGDANQLAEILRGMPAPVTPGSQLAARNPLDRSTAWGAPSSLAAGDVAGRIGNMGQTTGFGGV